MSTPEQIAAGLSEAQRGCLLAIHGGFGVGKIFRLDEGEHHAPYTALAKAGVLEKSRPGNFHTIYWLTDLGMQVRRILSEQSQ